MLEVSDDQSILAVSGYNERCTSLIDATVKSRMKQIISIGRSQSGIVD